MKVAMLSFIVAFFVFGAGLLAMDVAVMKLQGLSLIYHP